MLAPDSAAGRRSLGPSPPAGPARPTPYARRLQSAVTPMTAIPKPTTSDACRPCPLPPNERINRSQCVPSTASSRQPRSTSNAPRYRSIASETLAAMACGNRPQDLLMCSRQTSTFTALRWPVGWGAHRAAIVCGRAPFRNSASGPHLLAASDNRSSGAQRDCAGCASSQRYPYGPSSKDSASSSS